MTDLRLDEALDHAARNTFSTLFSRLLTPGAMRQNADIARFEGYSGVVGFGGNYRGALVFQCSRSLARTLTELLIGPGNADDASLRDAVGEISNVVAGGIKQRLSSTENLFDLCIPTVVEGDPHQISSVGRGEWTTARYLCDREEFVLAARLNPR